MKIKLARPTVSKRFLKNASKPTQRRSRKTSYTGYGMRSQVSESINILSEQMRTALFVDNNCKWIIYMTIDQLWILGNDIDVFVDIASSTMGEDALAAQKTTYLLNALHGYAPLIYEFPDPGRTLAEFWIICEQVWTYLKDNQKLPEHLVSGVKCWTN